ncbi:putative protein YviE [Paenibacillus solanacearum]|uniref:Uncharacterized protein n=1 Tax=Paenibacillus solanacearum TaxID=2048548 RepID=A0A916K2N7_9BACL|nr:DUF6470 family protein [Paenibacillus solanacearum]CAG7633989.1 putative protein YviE [Paenibacillus solanacearum]
MTSIPQIRINQQYSRIGIDTEPGHYEIKQPGPDQQYKTTPSRLEMESPSGELSIDSSKAWDALGIGSNYRLMDTIVSEARRIALQGIARRVEDGNRMADLTNKNDPIPEFAMRAFDDLDIEYRTSAAPDNVSIQYVARKPNIQFTPATLDIQTKVNAPSIEYVRGKLDIYLAQKAFIEIIPPEMDLKV